MKKSFLTAAKWLIGIATPVIVTSLITGQSLSGLVLLSNGQAGRAEAVFRADLEQYPRNPRSLFGLLKSLEAQKKSAGVEEVRRGFEATWKNADRPLELGDL